MTAYRLFPLTALLGVAACTPNELGHLEAKTTGDLTYAPAPRDEFDRRLAAACGVGGRTYTGDEHIDRAPYLQQVTDDSAMVVWTSSDTSAPTVIVTRPGFDDRIEVRATIDESAPLPNGSQYIAEITGLSPGAVYCYEIADANGSLYLPTGFETAPVTGGDAPVHFSVFGDVGQCTSDQFAVVDQLRTAHLDFALLTGDVGYSSGLLAEFESYYFDVYADLIDRVPFYPASGNHDYKTRGAGPFREAYVLPRNGSPDGTELYYSFDWGNVHVAVIDTEQIGAGQAAWLDADLSATDQPWKIVVGHRPPYSSGYHGSDPDMQRVFVPVFEKHGVQLALFGHDHSYERTKPINGVTYVVSGGGGVGTRPVGQSSYTAYSYQVSHFFYVTVVGDELYGYGIDATGKTFDTVRLSLADGQ